MPTLKEKEIQDLIQAIKEGRVSLDDGYQQACDAVPSLKKACGSLHYRDRFITWWCKFKKKESSQKLLQTPQPKPVAKQGAPVPPETAQEKAAKEQGRSSKPVAEKDQPPAKKGPKKPILNHIQVEPAPSPDSDPADCENVTNREEEPYQECDFFSELWKASSEPPSPTDKKVSKKASPKKPPATPKTTTTPDKTSSPMSDHLTPDEMACKLISEEKVPKNTFALTMGGDHGIEMYKIPHPDCETQIMCVTFVIFGATSAEMQPGGRKVHVEFPRMNVITGLKHEMETMRHFAEKLTNPTVKKDFDMMHDMLQVVLKKQHPTTVSIIYFVLQVNLSYSYSLS